MGQCSTLPEARQNAASSPVGRHGVHPYHDQERDDYATGRRNYHGYVPQKNQNATAAMTESFENETAAAQTGGGRSSSSKRSNHNKEVLQVKVPQTDPSTAPAASPNRSRQTVVHFAETPQQQPHTQQPHTQQQPQPAQAPGQTPPPYPRYNSGPQEPVPMEEERLEPLASPPESAVRTRCYKLNLESKLVGLTGGEARVSDGQLLGPFAEDPPALTSTISDDSSVTADATAVAVRTAQIFRGITISQDGTILTQNARATRANRNKNKRGEKSRQAAKIDKAKDLVEESIATGKAPNSEDPANMVSLVIFGEYDNMNHLVRDGAKKLRENVDLPDEKLLAVNHQRPLGATSPRSSSSTTRTPLHKTPSTLTRKRGSPHSASTQTRPSRYSSNSSNLPQSAPPKLKGHPRDRPSTRRLNNDNGGGGGGGGGGFRRFPVQDACTGMFAAAQHSGGTDSDWSGPLGFSRGLNSFFYCGGADQTVNPTQPTNKDNKGVAPHHMPPPPQPQPQQQPVTEYRNESAYALAQNQQQGRGETNSQRIDVPGRENIGSTLQV